jgi:hypothetical protein
LTIVFINHILQGEESFESSTRTGPCDPDQ